MSPKQAGGYQVGMGISAGDFDNDDWNDLHVACYGPNRLCHNNGDGTFTDVAPKLASPTRAGQPVRRAKARGSKRRRNRSRVESQHLATPEIGMSIRGSGRWRKRVTCSLLCCSPPASRSILFSLCR
jgi:hypothetical protein